MSKSKSELGFGAVADRAAVADDVRELASTLRPTPISDDGPSDQEVRRLVEAQTGTISQVPVRVVRKPMIKGATQNLSMRTRLETFNRFVTLSIELNLPYNETLEALLDAAGVDASGKQTRPLSRPLSRPR